MVATSQRYVGRHVRPSRRPTAGLAAVITAAGLALTLPPAGVAAAATGAVDCRQPVVRDVMVSQGLPSYGQLVRGKTALVKFFLSEPSSSSCPNVTSESTSITAGSLSVANGQTPAPSVSLPVVPTGALPEFSGYDVAPVTATPADPVFTVPGSLLTSSDPAYAAATLPVSFTATLDYVVKDSKGLTLASGRLPVTARPNGTPISATVSKPVKPARLLVVPMGNVDVTSPVQFPDTAVTEVTNGISAISRELPIPDGSGPLDGSAGLRWQLSAGMIDLGPHSEIDAKTHLPTTADYMSGGSFCGSGSSFSYISDQLSQFRAAWNAEHPTAQADRALGVVWQGISIGAQTGNGAGCSEGYAGVGGTTAWARVVAPNATRAGVTGSIAMVELTHGYGGSVVDVQQTTTGPVAGNVFPHSSSGNADRTAPNRAYNVPERRYLAAGSNRSVMTYDLAPYDDYTTLYEKADWDFVLCVLTSSSTTPSRDCGSPVSSTPTVSPAGGSYVLAGSTDGTVAGTDAHTYFDGDNPRDGTDAASSYRLVQRATAGGVVGASTGVRVTSTHSEHADGGSTAAPDERLSFNVAIAQADGATAFELWKGEPGTAGALLLYRRSLDGQAPVITATATAPAATTAVPYTSNNTSQQPALSPDGSLVAFTTPQGVVVARTSNSATRSLQTIPGGQAAWRGDGKQIAVVSSGEVYVASVDASGTGAPSLGSPSKVYGSQIPGAAPVASRPTYSPTGSELAVSINGDLFAVNLGLPSPEAYPVVCQLDAVVQDASSSPSGLACRRLTATPDSELAPAWSPAGVIAYERVAPASSVSRIWTLRGATPGTTQLQRLVAPAGSYTKPAWSGSRLLAARAAGLFSVDATSYAGLSEVTARAGDTWPAGSTAGDVLVFGRPSSTGSDLYTLVFANRGATATVTDDNPSQLRLDLYVVCTDSADPLVVAARPSAVDEAKHEAYFDLRFDESRTCTGGQLLYRATDGYQVARKLAGTIVGAGRAQAAIYLPKPSAAVLQYDTLTVAGAATSASGAATSQIAWRLTGPGYDQPLGSGTTLPPVVPPAGGWTPGTWTVSAVPDGDAGATTTRVFTILADTDADGIANINDTRGIWSCYPDDAATNAGNALADYDFDLIPSLLDPNPCVSAMNGEVVFNPRTLNLVSNGNPITLTLTTTALDVRTLQLSDVRISQVGGFDANLPAYTLTALSASQLEAKFDRQAFIDFFNARGFKGYVPVVLTATKGAVSVSGFDHSAPLYQPS